jgi:ABC-type multidrug transport system fused ATPase/permease subunit
MKDFFNFLLALDKRYKKIVSWLVFLILVGQGLGILLPYFSGKIIDSITQDASESFMPILGFIGMYFGLLIIGRAINHYKNAYEVKNFVFNFRPDVFFLGAQNFFSFSAGEHNEGNSHKKASVMNQGVSSAQQLMNIVFYQIGPTVFQTLVLLVALLFIKPVVAFIVLISLALNIFLQLKVTSKFLPEFDKWEQVSKERHTVAGEHIRNVDLTKNLGAEDLSMREVMNQQHASENLGKDIWLRFDRWLHLIGLLNPITTALLFILSSWWTYTGLLTAGQFLMIVSWGGMATAGIGRVQWYQRNIMQALPSFRDFQNQLAKKSELKIAEKPIKKGVLAGEIEYRNVSHSYSNDEQKMFEMKGVSLVIPSGEKVAFAGVSGSGKSTLVKLLLRNFDPEEGEVLVDGHDLRDLDLKSYLADIGYVSQETRLFDTTIQENLIYGLRRRVTEEEILRALDIANLKEKVLMSPKGLKSKIGEQGIQLSGGERQRLAIARAILRKPKILIFDEATSNLDAINEKEIQSAIDKAAKGRTAIMIAHRLSTVINADRIFFFEKGKLLAEGTHEELLVLSPKYQELCSHQYLDVATV